MSGHGHVTPNPDGSKARCGGPGICSACSIEAARKRKGEPHSTRPRIRLDLRCTCGSTLGGTISAPLTDVIKMRDVFLSFHREDGHSVTDKSEDVS